MPLAIGIIGAGNMGADHANTLHRYVSGAEVVLVGDVDQPRAETAVASIPGARATGRAQAVIDDPAVAAVVIASHDSTHAELVLACLEAGKPVLCEKPLAPTLAECVDVVRAQQAAGTELISLGFMRRFDPGYVQIKAGIESADLGPALMLHAIARGVSSGPGTTNESAVTNSSIHDLDILPWLVGSPVVEVSWQAPTSSSRAAGFSDPSLILLRTASGVLGTVETFLNARYGYDVRCEVVCETGTLSLTEPAKVQRDAARSRGIGYPADWRPRFADAYRLELQAWVDAVTTGSPTPLATAADGLRAAAVADAVQVSMHEGGRTVAVEVPAL